MASRLQGLLVPLLVLCTGACFATRNDVRVLQGDVLTLRQEAARRDTAYTRQVAQLSTQMSANLSTINDSIKGLNARLALNLGDTRGEFRQVRDMLIQLQQLVGASQQMISRYQADNEARLFEQRQAAAAAATPPPVPTDSATAAGVRPMTNPALTVGPNQLYQEGLNQSRRESYAAAQAAFEELLKTYPTFEYAPDAMYFLGSAYEADGKYPQADSTWLGMVAAHPRAARAPGSLYKMAQSLAKRGRRAEARAMMERVSKEYPTADEADLARDWLMRNR